MKVDGVNAPNKAYINSQYQDDGAFAGIYATPIEAGYSGSEATVTVDLLSVYRAARMGQYRYQSIWAAVYKVSGASVDSITTTTSTDWTSQYFRADLTSDDSLILLSQAYSKYGTRDFEVSPVDPEYAYEPFDGKREASPDILGGFPFTYSDVLTSRPQCRVAMAFNPLQ